MAHASCAFVGFTSSTRDSLAEDDEGVSRQMIQEVKTTAPGSHPFETFAHLIATFHELSRELSREEFMQPVVSSTESAISVV